MYTPWLIPEGHEYQYDLGWLVRKLLAFETELNTAIDLKTIHYADPLQWDITTQYSPNTVVVDPKTGTAYMSKVPVPSGVQLTNTDYWVVVFNYQRIYDKIMSGVAFNDQDNLESSKDIQKYDFVWYGGDLYQAQRDIPQGAKYVPDVNIVPATIADALAAYYGDTRTAAVTSDTVTVAETQTIAAKNRVINVTGDQTITAGDIAETSANRTIKTIADYHVDVDGNFSDHVDGVTTKNYGGAVTAAYGSSLDIGVTGTYTADYSGTVTETFKNKRNVTLKDTTVTASGNMSISANQFDLTSNEKTFPIRFPDKTVDLYNVGSGVYSTPQDFGAIGDGVADDTNALQTLFSTANGIIMIPDGTYICKKPITIREGLYIVGSNHSKILFSGNSGIVVTGRYVNIHNLHIWSKDKTGTGITLGGSDSHYVLIDNVYITDFNIGITNTTFCWCNTFRNVRITESKTGILLKSFNIANFCMTFENVYTNHCDVALKTTTVYATFTGCNFGITQDSTFDIGNSRLEFVNCNFECDEKILTTIPIFNISGAVTAFRFCKFLISAGATSSVFGFYTGVDSIIFENCNYSTKSENEMPENNFFLPSQFNASIGGIQIKTGCKSLPRPDLNRISGARQRNFKDLERVGDVIQYTNSISTDGLNAGTLVYNTTTNELGYFNGTEIVTIKKSEPVSL